MDFIKFLGTAGSRFVTLSQLRASGGIWLKYKKTNIIIDPGPGAIVKCNSSKLKLNPKELDAIILTHKHLDHCGDVNIMIEAMTEGGFKKKGVLFVPQDALGPDGVVFSYLQNHPQKITILKKGNFSVGDIKFKVEAKNIHAVDTWGLKFYLEDEVVSLVSDTKYFDQLIDVYKDSSILILNVVFHQKMDQFQHLCLEEALRIIKSIKPKKAILTHFGMSILQQGPHLLEEEVKKSLDMDIKFAYDGMTLNLP
jgi:ribonuclease BN (tRNA processing enzyme)